MCDFTAAKVIDRKECMKCVVPHNKFLNICSKIAILTFVEIYITRYNLFSMGRACLFPPSFVNNTTVLDF